MGYVDGPRATAKLNSPFNVAVMPNGSLIVSEWSQRIRLVCPLTARSRHLPGMARKGFLDGPCGDRPIYLSAGCNGVEEQSPQRITSLSRTRATTNSD